MHKYNKIITNWVLWGQFSTMDAWSYLVLVRNDQKKNTFQAQVVPTTGDGAHAPWLQQHSISTFFLGHPVYQHFLKGQDCYFYLQGTVCDY